MFPRPPGKHVLGQNCQASGGTRHCTALGRTMQRERWLSGQRYGDRPLTRSFYGWWPTAVFLARAGFIVIWLPLDVRCCRPVLARGWHGVIAGTGCCIALLHVFSVVPRSLPVKSAKVTPPVPSIGPEGCNREDYEPHPDDKDHEVFRPRPPAQGHDIQQGCATDSGVSGGSPASAPHQVARQHRAPACSDERRAQGHDVHDHLPVVRLPPRTCPGSFCPLAPIIVAGPCSARHQVGRVLS